MITTATTSLASQIANIADNEGVTVRHIVNRLAREGMEGCTEALVQEAHRYHREMIDNTLRRARRLNDGADVTTTTETRKVEYTPATTKRQMGEVVRAQIFGYSATSVLRWMGANGWGFEDAAVVMATIGAARIADSTIRIQLNAGRDGRRGPAAPVTPAQAKKLRELAK